MVLMAVADANHRFVYIVIGSYIKVCDSTVFKRSTLWTSVQKNILQLPSERLSGTEGPHIPHFFVGDEGFALNRNILWPFVGSNMSVNKKECTTTACAEHEGMWNVLLVFWAINREFFSDRLMSVLTLQSSLRPVFCTILFLREMVISLKMLWHGLILKMYLKDNHYVGFNSEQYKE